MLERFFEFWKFSDPNVVWVALGSLLLGATAGLIGTFPFLRKRALVGDALAHAALPGVMTAFLLTHSRDPLVLLLGAFLGCALGYVSIEALTLYTKIKEDSALGN